MEGRGETGQGQTRAIVYCIVPRDLAAKLYDPLRRHFHADPAVDVIVEQRTRDRRRGSERRTTPGGPYPDDRRKIRDEPGRRIAEQRAPLLEGESRPLPRKAARYANRLTFVERLEPSTVVAEDRDTARIVMRVQAGETEAFTELYMRYFDRVYSYLRVTFRDHHRAEDATQQAFMKVFEALPRYTRSRSPFRAWLFAIVRNHAIDELERGARVEIRERLDVDRPSVYDDEAAAELSALDWVTDKDLTMLIDRLPLAQRQVLFLRFTLDLTHRQVADILGRNPDDVRNLQSRALAFMRARLAALGREPARRRARMVRCPRKAPVLRSRRFALTSR